MIAVGKMQGKVIDLQGNGGKIVSQCPWPLLLQIPSAPSLWRGQKPGQARQAGKSPCQEGNYEALAPVKPLQKRAEYKFAHRWAGN